MFPDFLAGVHESFTGFLFPPSACHMLASAVYYYLFWLPFIIYDYNLHPWSVLQFSEVSFLYIPPGVNLLYFLCCVFLVLFLAWFFVWISYTLWTNMALVLFRKFIR